MKVRWWRSVQDLERTVDHKTDAFVRFLGAPLGEGSHERGAFMIEASLEARARSECLHHATERIDGSEGEQRWVHARPLHDHTDPFRGEGCSEEAVEEQGATPFSPQRRGAELRTRVGEGEIGACSPPPSTRAERR